MSSNIDTKEEDSIKKFSVDIVQHLTKIVSQINCFRTTTNVPNKWCLFELLVPKFNTESENMCVFMRIIFIAAACLPRQRRPAKLLRQKLNDVYSSSSKTPPAASLHISNRMWVVKHVQFMTTRWYLSFFLLMQSTAKHHVCKKCPPDRQML